ncbi:MAG: PssE/Cps14G family polysaccharide biosynthesis glycosyltransferase [Shewanella sp.]
MKILVTVGSGSYDSLVRILDYSLNPECFNVFFQIGEGKYIPKRHPYSRFVPNIASRYERFDLIISHCGAGTVFECLLSRTPLFVIPNTERIDKHQLDLAKYLYLNNFCQVLYTADDVVNKVVNYNPKVYSDYKYRSFFGSDFILSKILE